MGKGHALIVGVPKPSRESGWRADYLPGVLNDVRSMSSFLGGLGFQLEVLKEEAATAKAVLNGIRRAADALSAGDMFVLCYSGHGAPQDSSDADETVDQLLLTYDRPIVDDELGARWPLFAKYVRIVVVTDSCHSGSVVRKLETPRGTLDVVEPRSETLRTLSIGLATAAREDRGDRDGDIAGLQGSLIHLAACQDTQLAFDMGSNGVFTNAMLTAWNAGFRNNYESLFNEAVKRVALRPPPPGKVPQKPRKTCYGSFQGYFNDQPPFSPGTKWPPF
jgi:hypothetical protein